MLIKKILFLIAGASISWGALGQQAFSFCDSAMTERMRKDVYCLASDSFQGRKSGTTGEKLAYEYIIREFREAGIQPMGTDSGSYLQEFPNNFHEFHPEDTKLSCGDHAFSYYRDFGILGYSTNGEASGILYNAGNGISCLDEARKGSAGDRSLSGRIVLMNLAVPRNLGEDSNATARKRLQAIQQMGASGVIVWNRDVAGVNKLFDFDSFDTLGIPMIYVNSSTRDSLLKHPSDTIRMAVRVTRSFERFHNVIGFIDNHAPYTIIFGAHYDHVGIGSRTKMIKNGADDNASGTAMIMELARYYASRADRRSNYLFIALSGEEEWLRGSQYFTKHPTIDLKTVNFMFNLDMVGRLGCQGKVIEVVCTGTSPDWKKILKEAPRKGFRIKKISGAGEFSDHYPFYKKDLPISYLTSGIHPDYHTSRDDADRINYAGMNNILAYAKSIVEGAEQKGKIRFRKVSGWENVNSMWYYISEQFDFMLTRGTSEVFKDN